MLGQGERSFLALRNANLTEAERGDAVHLQPGDVLQFHQNTKGHQRGERLQVGSAGRLPLEHAERYQVFHISEIALAPGDVVRITHNGRTADDKHRLDNGMVFRVKEFDQDGNIVLQNGWTLDKNWGHLDYGYVVTSHKAQARTIDHHVLIGQSARSFAASSREAVFFYVSVSRSKEKVTIYTDDKTDPAGRRSAGLTPGSPRPSW